MAVVALVTCSGAWDAGRMPCRGAFPARGPVTRPEARSQARAAGWSFTPDGADLCPAHTRLAAEEPR